jgi:hypothetical protein
MYVISSCRIVHSLCTDNQQWLTFSAVSSTASQFFQVSESAINWLSTGFLFAFVIASPYDVSIAFANVATDLLPTDSLYGPCTEVPRPLSLLLPY